MVGRTIRGPILRAFGKRSPRNMPLPKPTVITTTSASHPSCSLSCLAARNAACPSIKAGSSRRNRDADGLQRLDDGAHSELTITVWLGRMPFISFAQEDNLISLSRPRRCKTAELTWEVVVTDQQLHAGKALANIS